jgi:acetoin:2,6-dichlorophenolindophenol oxidoreductase subunit beta
MSERRWRYVDAIRFALREELDRDPEVCLYGEDVTLGGPFGATRDLAEQFGEHRIKNTPISEATVVGLAVGAATVGARPVVEVMFADFITLAMDQLVNHAAKLRYMTGGQLSVPLTVRSTFGVGGGWGAHHSQSLENWLAHVPGLNVAMPSCAADARGLLQSAIRDDDPTIFLEHRALYFTAGPVPDGDSLVPLGQAAVRRPGADVTVVAVSRMVDHALAAADRLAAQGIDVEVIDPRTIVPLDLDTIVASARKTGRVVVAHEAVVKGGVGGEIAASVQEAAFDYLDAPILRVGAPFAPVPAAAALEEAFTPATAEIEVAVREGVRGGAHP